MTSLKLSLWRDKDGIHCEDAVSHIGLHWKTSADVRAWLKQNDGEDWEQSFRAAMKDIVANVPELDRAIDGKDFTLTPAKVDTTWP